MLEAQVCKVSVRGEPQFRHDHVRRNGVGDSQDEVDITCITDLLDSVTLGAS